MLADEPMPDEGEAAGPARSCGEDRVPGCREALGARAPPEPVGALATHPCRLRRLTDAPVSASAPTYRRCRSFVHPIPVTNFGDSANISDEAGGGAAGSRKLSRAGRPRACQKRDTYLFRKKYVSPSPEWWASGATSPSAEAADRGRARRRRSSRSAAEWPPRSTKSPASPGGPSGYRLSEGQEKLPAPSPEKLSPASAPCVTSLATSGFFHCALGSSQFNIGSSASIGFTGFSSTELSPS